MTNSGPAEAALFFRLGQQANQVIAILPGMLGLHLAEVQAHKKRFKISDADEMCLNGFPAVLARESLPLIDRPVVGREPFHSLRPHILTNTSRGRHFAFVYERQRRVGIEAFLNFVALCRAQ